MKSFLHLEHCMCCTVRIDRDERLELCVETLQGPDSIICFVIPIPGAVFVCVRENQIASSLLQQ